MEGGYGGGGHGGGGFSLGGLGGGSYGSGGHGGRGYGGGYGYQRPQQLLKIIKNDEPDGLFDTLLNFFSVGFEPLILLLGLASLATTAVLFVAITNAGKRSFGARLVRRENMLKLLGDQQEEELEDMDRKVKQGNIERKKRYLDCLFFQESRNLKLHFFNRKNRTLFILLFSKNIIYKI